MSNKRVPWVKAYAGPDYYRGRGWVMWILLLPAPDVMTKREEGHLILCGLSVTIRTQTRFPWLSFHAYSDANEIACRRAGDFSGAL